MTKFAVLLGGRVFPTPRLFGQLSGARVIAADGGIAHAGELALSPEKWVGDFDSTPPRISDAYAHVPRETFPAEKASTDGEIAIAEALALGATSLVVVGAMGGERTDHALGHLLHALALRQQGIDVLLTSGDEEAYPMLAGERILDLPEASLFSVMGFTALHGLSIRGARYPLDLFDLPFGSSRTISNVSEGVVKISLKSGLGIVLARPYDLTGV